MKSTFRPQKILLDDVISVKIVHELKKKLWKSLKSTDFDATVA